MMLKNTLKGEKHHTAHRRQRLVPSNRDLQVDLTFDPRVVFVKVGWLNAQ